MPKKSEVTVQDVTPKPPAAYMTMAQNLKAAATAVGSGGGHRLTLFMRVCDRTGAVTAGPSRDPVPLKQRYAVPGRVEFYLESYPPNCYTNGRDV